MIQVAGRYSQVDKVSELERWSYGNTKISHYNINKHIVNSKWVFSCDCVDWKSGSISLSYTKMYLDSLSSLSKEGVYCYKERCWKRIFVTRDHISIILLEDVPDSGGQMCIWTAGLVMARYLEFSCVLHIGGRNSCQRGRLLELGAGAGLTSMVAAIILNRSGNCWDVVSTEQGSCVKYLERNIQQNPELEPIISVLSLNWEADFDIGTFDIILGCDITYDYHNFNAIFAVIDKLLTSNGSFWICHDNDSCPLSPKSVNFLETTASAKNFLVEDISYRDVLPIEYYSEKVKIWRVTRRHPS